MSRKTVSIIIVSAAAVGIAVVLWLGHSVKNRPGQTEGMRGIEETEKAEYWTCSMHPQVRRDGPGDCPICGMDLIPVYARDEGKIRVTEEVARRLGVVSQPVRRNEVIKSLRILGRTARDEELYALEQDYLSILSSLNSAKGSSSGQILEGLASLVEAARSRLELLGLSNGNIREIELRGKPDKSLIYPGSGRVWVHADIYEQDLRLVKVGQQVTLRIKGYEKEGFKGEIRAIERTLNPLTHAAKARIEVSDPGNELKLGLYADLDLKINLGNLLSIPVSSLIDTGTRKVVYVYEGDGRYGPREVRTGVEGDDMVEVTQGLAENDMVVTNGNFLLDSETTLTGGQSLLYGASEEIKQPSKEHGH